MSGEVLAYPTKRKRAYPQPAGLQWWRDPQFAEVPRLYKHPRYNVASEPPPAGRRALCYTEEEFAEIERAAAVLRCAKEKWQAFLASRGFTPQS